MVDYIKDEGGIVHVINNTTPGGEFTFCGREYGCGGDAGNDEFDGEIVLGPASCPDCRKTVDAIRASIKGVKWKPSPNAEKES